MYHLKFMWHSPGPRRARCSRGGVEVALGRGSLCRRTLFAWREPPSAVAHGCSRCRCLKMSAPACALVPQRRYNL